MTDRNALNEAYKTAMKARDEVAVRTLRLLLADIKRVEVDERREVTASDVLTHLQRNIKKRNETIEAAKSQNRQDMVDAETAELRVLERFMPKQLSEAETIELVEAVIRETGATTKKEQGKVMTALMAKAQGRAEGKLLARLVGERLT